MDSHRAHKFMIIESITTADLKWIMTSHCHLPIDESVSGSYVHNLFKSSLFDIVRDIQLKYIQPE